MSLSSYPEGKLRDYVCKKSLEKEDSAYLERADQILDYLEFNVESYENLKKMNEVFSRVLSEKLRNLGLSISDLEGLYPFFEDFEQKLDDFNLSVNRLDELLKNQSHPAFDKINELFDRVLDDYASIKKVGGLDFWRNYSSLKGSERELKRDSFLNDYERLKSEFSDGELRYHLVDFIKRKGDVDYDDEIYADLFVRRLKYLKKVSEVEFTKLPESPEIIPMAPVLTELPSMPELELPEYPEEIVNKGHNLWLKGMPERMPLVCAIDVQSMVSAEACNPEIVEELSKRSLRAYCKGLIRK